jgi:hypothetical protein
MKGGEIGTISLHMFLRIWGHGRAVEHQREDRETLCQAIKWNFLLQAL